MSERVCDPAQGRGEHDFPVPGVRHFQADRLQDLWAAVIGAEGARQAALFEESRAQLHTLLFRDVLGMLWGGQEPSQRGVASFGVCQGLYGMRFASFLLSFCHARKCEGRFQLRPQKTRFGSGWLLPEAAPTQMLD